MVEVIITGGQTRVKSEKCETVDVIIIMAENSLRIHSLRNINW